MGLGPPPEELKLIDWGRPYGLLPSRFTSEDYRWLALAERLEEVRRLNELWQNPQTAIRLSRNAVEYIMNLRKEAKQLVKRLEEDG